MRIESIKITVDLMKKKLVELASYEIKAIKKNNQNWYE